MRRFTTLALAACALAATALPAAAQTVSRDELRACMDAESDLARRRTALEADRVKVRDETAAVRAESQAMADEEKRLKDAGEQEGSPKVDRFQRKVRAFNDRVKALQAASAAANTDLDSVNAAVVAYNGKCGAISFRPEDKEAILKERAAAGK